MYSQITTPHHATPLRVSTHYAAIHLPIWAPPCPPPAHNVRGPPPPPSKSPTHRIPVPYHASCPRAHQKITSTSLLSHRHPTTPSAHHNPHRLRSGFSHVLFSSGAHHTMRATFASTSSTLPARDITPRPETQMLHSSAEPASLQQQPSSSSESGPGPLPHRHEHLPLHLSQSQTPSQSASAVAAVGHLLPVRLPEAASLPSAPRSAGRRTPTMGE